MDTAVIDTATRAEAADCHLAPLDSPIDLFHKENEIKSTVSPSTLPVLALEPRTESGQERVKKKVLLKTDMALMPLMFCIVVLTYLDKAILAYAALLGLPQDLHITGTQYSWAASIYYFGFISGLLLWTALLQRFTTDKIIGSAATIWGVVCMCHAAVHNYDQILTVRFLLGFFESAVTPSFVLITGQFYTERETISRTAIWYSANGVALIIGGSMSWSLFEGRATSTSSIAIWRELYLILGSLTIFFGIFTLVLMPSSPYKTRLYNEEERKVAVGRITTHPGRNAKALLDRDIWRQSLEALRDIRLYVIFVGLTSGSIPNGGVTAYSTYILAGFGYSISETLLLTLAPGGAQIVSVLLFIGTSLLFRSRAMGGIALMLFAIVGAALMYSADVGPITHVVGYCLLNMGSPAIVALYSFNAAAVGGHGKRVIFAAGGQLAYATGNIIGPLTFLSDEQPVYRTGKAIIVGTLCLAACSLVAILAIHMKWNKMRDAAGSSSIQSNTADEGNMVDRTSLHEQEGKTDFEDKTYRYVL